MDEQASVAIATKMKEAVTKLNEIVDYMRTNVASDERAPINRAIGDIFAIATDEIYSRLVRANPGLHDMLFHGLPPGAADDFLRLSSDRNSTR